MKFDKTDSTLAENDRAYVAQFRGGAGFVIAEIMIAAEIEERAERTVRAMLGRQQDVYFRDLFPGGFIASSAGVFPTFAAAASDPDNPAKPRYRLREFVDIFAEHLPYFLPRETGVVVKKSLIYGLDDWEKWHAPSYRLFTSGFVRGAAFTLTNIITAGRYKQPLSDIFGVVAAHRRKEVFVQVDKEAAYQVLEKVVGAGTMISDLPANIVVSAQRAFEDRSAAFNSYFVHLLPDRRREAKPVSGIGPTPGESMIDVILSTTAVPMVHDNHRGYQDGGGITCGIEVLEYLAKNLKDGDRLGYVSFGNFDRTLFANGDLNAGPRLMREVANMEAILVRAAKEANELAIQAKLDEHATFFEIPMHIKTPNGPIAFAGTTNMLDASPEQVAAIKAHTQAWIGLNNGQIDDLARRLAEGYIARTERTMRERIRAAIETGEEDYRENDPQTVMPFARSHDDVPLAAQ